MSSFENPETYIFTCRSFLNDKIYHYETISATSSSLSLSSSFWNQVKSEIYVYGNYQMIKTKCKLKTSHTEVDAVCVCRTNAYTHTHTQNTNFDLQNQAEDDEKWKQNKKEEINK